MQHGPAHNQAHLVYKQQEVAKGSAGGLCGTAALKTARICDEVTSSERRILEEFVVAACRMLQPHCVWTGPYDRVA